MSMTTRRAMIGALAASGAALAATRVQANPKPLNLTDLKKDTDIACL
jgi:hypothetical protein